MEGKTIKANMSKGEWRIDEEGRVTDSELCTIAHFGDTSFNYEVEQTNKYAIVSAVNGSYGKGLDPAIYEEIHGVLEGLFRMVKHELGADHIKRVESLLQSAKL